MVILSILGSNAATSNPSAGRVKGVVRRFLGGGKVEAATAPLGLEAVLQASRKEVVAAAMPRKRPVLRNVLFSMMDNQ